MPSYNESCTADETVVQHQCPPLAPETAVTIGECESSSCEPSGCEPSCCEPSSYDIESLTFPKPTESKPLRGWVRKSLVILVGLCFLTPVYLLTLGGNPTSATAPSSTDGSSPSWMARIAYCLCIELLVVLELYRQDNEEAEKLKQQTSSGMTSSDHRGELLRWMVVCGVYFAVIKIAMYVILISHRQFAVDSNLMN